MNIEIKAEEGTLIVEISGELDMVVADEFKQKVERLLSQKKYDKLILDFKNVSFIDSSGLGVILGRYKTISQYNGRMAIVSVQNPVQKILELSGILRILNIYPDVSSAIAAM
ncbi:anti-sigma F factor antagonist [Bacillota bacterium LX-D]|nr:anti-sigma F factor antagonist [Bacillota bacterium LX-D]